MDNHFFKETYPAVGLYGVFLLGLAWNFSAWVEIYADDDTPTLLSSRKGQRTARFIRKHPLLYRILSTLTFGVIPVYFLISKEYKYRTSLYLLLVLYSIWVFEKIIRMIISKSAPEKETFPPESFQTCSACHKPVMKVMAACPHCQNKLN